MSPSRYPGLKISDRLIIMILMGILAVLCTVVIIGNRDAQTAAREARDAATKAEEAVVRTDIISECFTPNTRCSRFRAEADQRQQEYFKSLMETTAMCIILTGRALPDTGDLPLIERVYKQCVLDRAAPPPPAPVDD